MSSRSLQIKAIMQKIERLQAQLEYLQKIEKLEAKQTNEIESSSQDDSKKI